MEQKELKDLFKKAADIASKVPQSMQAAAFNRALNILKGDDKVGKGKEKVKRKKKKKPKAGRKESFTLLKDLNLRGDSKVTSLKKLVEEKKPKSNIQFNALAIYYLKQVLRLKNVTPNHIYTCYREVKRRPPGKFQQSLWDTSGSKYGYIDGSDMNDLKIPHRGVTFVEHDLPPSKKKG